MLIGFWCGFPSPWCAFNKSFLYQEGLIDLLQGSGFFSHRSGYGSDAYRPTLKFINNSRKYAVVHMVKTMFIHIERLQGMLGNANIYLPVIQYLCKVPHPAQKAIGYTWSAPAAPGYFCRSFIAYFHIQYMRSPQNDLP